MSVSTPPATSSLLAAAQWLEGLVQGPLAVTLAVLAVAATGLMMLSGRLPVRRGFTVTLGCFVLFGAPAIARGIMSSASAVASPDPIVASDLAAEQGQSFPPPPPAPPAAADPYAGASISQ